MKFFNLLIVILMVCPVSFVHAKVTMEGCASSVSEFEIQIKKIDPIIKLSNNEFPIALELITPSFIKQVNEKCPNCNKREE